MMSMIRLVHLWWVGWGACVCALCLSGWMWNEGRTRFLANSSATASITGTPSTSHNTERVSFFNEVFKKQDDMRPTTSAGLLASRFRLAGTFFAFGDKQMARNAIIDDLRKKDQKLVSEGDPLDDAITVVSIQTDRIRIRDGSREEELLLSFSGAISNRANVAKTPATNVSVTKTSRFGEQVEGNRWIIKRDELLTYYQELMANPERLAKVFESLKPVYREKKIMGYVVDVEGEADMFAAFGLKQGDIVKKVNSMPMTSQARAEYFIHEFVKDRVNGFVLDIERESKQDRMIYMMR